MSTQTTDRNVPITASVPATLLLDALFEMGKAGKITVAFHDRLWDWLRNDEAQYEGRSSSEDVLEGMRQAFYQGTINEIVTLDDVLDWIIAHPALIASAQEREQRGLTVCTHCADADAPPSAHGGAIETKIVGTERIA